MLPFITMAQTYIIHNPYEGVNWETYGHYKANFHTHIETHGELPLDSVIWYYTEKGDYDILAITEHNQVVWPWHEPVLIYDQLTSNIEDIPDDWSNYYAF